MAKNRFECKGLLNSQQLITNKISGNGCIIWAGACRGN